MKLRSEQIAPRKKVILFVSGTPFKVFNFNVRYKSDEKLPVPGSSGDERRKKRERRTIDQRKKASGDWTWIVPVPPRFFLRPQSKTLEQDR